MSKNESNVVDLGENESIDLNNLDQFDGKSDDVDIDLLNQLIGDSPSTNHKNEVQDEEDLSKLSIDELLNRDYDSDDSDGESLPDSETKKIMEKEESAKLAKNAELDERIHEIKINGEVKKYDISGLKELAQKGLDYTQKTQDLSKQRIALQKEVEQLETKRNEIFSQLDSERQKYQNDLALKEQMDFIYNYMKDDNPDLYQEIQEYSKLAQRHFSNPVVDKLQAKINELEKREQEKKHQDIMSNYYSELDNLKRTIIPKVEKLGITLDEELILNTWGKNGNLNVRQAFDAIYGDQIRKISESRAKVEHAKKVTKNAQTLPLTKGSTPKKITQARKYSDYGDISRSILGY